MNDKTNKDTIDYLIKHKKKLDNIYILIICNLIIYTDFNYKYLKELLRGGHFIIKGDNGKMYDIFKKISNCKSNTNFRNISSHVSCEDIVRVGKNMICDIDGKENKNFDCLIGKICDNKKKGHNNCNTWFQFEKTRIDGLINKINHSIDYIRYIIIRKNIGPFGNSKYTDKNPIKLKIIKN